MDDGWLSANDAYEMLAAVSPGPVAEAICARAHDGLIRARARRYIVDREVNDDVQVPAEFWWARGQEGLKQDWRSGDFETWVNQGSFCRAYGVVFRREEIEAMLPAKKQPQQFNRASPGNYESALRSQNELCKSLGCSTQEAARLIIRACAAGMLASRCSTLNTRVRDRFGEDDEVSYGIAIPEWVWSTCFSAGDAIMNWPAGRFSGSAIRDGDEYRVIASCVEFEARGIIEIESMEIHSRRGGSRKLADAEPSTATGAITAPSGRRLSKLWRPWVAELVSHVHTNGIPEGQGSQGQEELISAVADALALRGEEAPGRSTVQPVVQAVLDRLRSAEN